MSPGSHSQQGRDSVGSRNVRQVTRRSVPCLPAGDDHTLSKAPASSADEVVIDREVVARIPEISSVGGALVDEAMARDARRVLAKAAVR